MLLPRLDRRTGGDLHRRRGVVGLDAACGQHRLPQALELRVLGMQIAQVGIGGIRGRDGLHQGLGIVDGRLLVEQAADRRRVEAPATGVPPILEDGEAELDLGVGQRLGCRRCFRRCRHLEGGRLEPPIIGLADLGDGLRGTRRKAVLARPDGLAAALGVERREPRVIPLIDRVVAGRCRSQSLTDCHDDRVNLGGRLGLCRGDRRTGRGRRGAVHLGGRERIGRSRGACVQTQRMRRFAGRALAPGRSGKAAPQHRYCKHDCKQRSVDHPMTPRRHVWLFSKQPNFLAS